jgi:hypothetical protein
MQEIKRYQLIACKVLQREVYECAAKSPNNIDVVFLEQGLHNEPDKLKTRIQEAVERDCDEKGRKYDATLLGYGLCSNGIVGIKSPVKLVVPRAHDCITLLLGSKEKYRKYFDTHKGIYWYSPGWIDTGTQPGRQRYEQTRAEYEQKYGKDNADYLMEMEQNWMNEYQRAVFIDWGMVNARRYREYTRKCAEYMGWEYDRLEGDPRLLEKLMAGQWDKEEFLVLEPGETIKENLTGEGIIKSSR